MTSLLPQVPELSAAELASALESGEPIQIMDVRAPEKVQQGRIDAIADERFHNIRGSDLMRIGSVEETGLDPKLPVVLVCGAGKDSAVVAFHLGRLGLDARSLRGGLFEWFNLTLPRDLDPPEGLDRLIQFDRIGKGCLGYLLASKGEAIIVDPPLRAGAFLEILGDLDARLVGVADTHVHADYVSGAVALAQSLDVPYYLHPADAVYPYDGTPGRIEFHPVSDGDVIPFGVCALTVDHTPGHTEGSVTFRVEGRVALTGDFLFVESIGRPDLGGKEEEWANQLWDSVQRAKREWDPGTAIYPAHYASDRERKMGQAVGIPMERLLAENPLLRIQSREVFLAAVLEKRAPFPEAYRKIKALNLGLASVVQAEVEELELGRNECALGGV